LRRRSGGRTDVPDEWWTLFNDPVLDELERGLVIGNENLKVSAAQLASARDLRGQP
jgi:hypothetical protein